MVDADNDPTKLIEIVEIGKQLLMTRGTLTTFSIANDVAKYFSIVTPIHGLYTTISSSQCDGASQIADSYHTKLVLYLMLSLSQC